jgi:hypothetical protein
MTEARWRAVAIALAAVLALALGIAIAISLPSGTTPGASSSAAGSSSAGERSGTPSTEPGTSGEPSVSAEPSAPAPASPSAPASASPSPSPTIPPAPTAQITFTDVRLDAQNDLAVEPRTFTFRTDGAGKVTVKLTAKSPAGTTRMCLMVGSTAPLCRSWASGTLTGITSAKMQTTFVVTLIGVGISTPTVDLALTFRARSPSVTLTNSRFDGTAPEFDGYNGLSGRVKIRSDGNLAVTAEWGAKPFDYAYQIVDLTAPSPGGLFPGNGTGIDRTDPVVRAHSYGFSLTNGTAGLAMTPLTFTIGWP